MSVYFPEASERGRHTIFPGVTIETAAAERMSLSVATLAPDAVVEEHSHPHEQVGIVIRGRALFIVGGEERMLGPGDLYSIPGGVKHKVIATAEGCQALDVFAPVREEYR